MGTKMAVAFANIYMAAIETQILSQNTIELLALKRYIDDIFSPWNNNRQKVRVCLSSKPLSPYNQIYG